MREYSFIIMCLFILQILSRMGSQGDRSKLIGVIDEGTNTAQFVVS